MADEARLNELLDLVEQARAEGDKETEAKAIAAYRNESAPSQPQQSTPAQPQQPNTFGQAFKNVAQAGAHGLTGMVGGAAGDVAGLGQIPLHASSGWMNRLRSSILPESIAGPLNRLQSVEPDAMRSSVSGALTYTPENRDTLSMKIVEAPGRLIGGAGEQLRTQADKFDKSGTLGNFAAAAPQALASILGIKGAQLARGMAVPAGRMGNLSAETIYKQVPSASVIAAAQPKVPTTEELTQASRAAYAANKDAGVIVPAKGYSESLGKVQKMATEEGIDPTLHPKSTAVLRRLEEANGKDLSLQEAETLRKIALDAEDDLNPVTRQPTPDARLAGKIVDELDDSIEALSTNSEARALWARSRRSQMIDQMIHRAKIRAGAHYTQAGMEHALRQEFKTLALNPRRMRGLTAEQKAAIEKVAKGGSVENTLRALGKFDPTSSVVSAAGSLGTSALLSSINPAAAALPVAGFVAKRLATRATKRNVDLAREMLVGRGLPKPTSAQPSGLPANTLTGSVPTRPRLQGIPSQMRESGPVRMRPSREIQADIQRLTDRVQFQLRNSQASSPEIRDAISELQALQRELEASREGQ
jgi:hypothetical protein